MHGSTLEFLFKVLLGFRPEIELFPSKAETAVFPLSREPAIVLPSPSICQAKSSTSQSLGTSNDCPYAESQEPPQAPPEKLPA